DMSMKDMCRLSRPSTAVAREIVELAEPPGDVQGSTAKELRALARNVHQGRRNTARPRAPVQDQVQLVAERGHHLLCRSGRWLAAQVRAARHHGTADPLQERIR